MRLQGAPDLAIARLATLQGGVASHEQLLALGVSPEAVQRRVRAGGLLPVHRGVYAVGHGSIVPRGGAGRRYSRSAPMRF